MNTSLKTEKEEDVGWGVTWLSHAPFDWKGRLVMLLGGRVLVSVSKHDSMKYLFKVGVLPPWYGIKQQITCKNCWSYWLRLRSSPHLHDVLEDQKLRKIKAELAGTGFR